VINVANNSLRSQKQKPVKNGMERTEALKEILMISGETENTSVGKAILSILDAMDDKMFMEAYVGLKARWNERRR